MLVLCVRWCGRDDKNKMVLFYMCIYFKRCERKCFFDVEYMVVIVINYIGLVFINIIVVWRRFINCLIYI